MADEVRKTPDLLPVRQRIAWMAAIWLASVGTMALASLAVRALLT